jgi:hypothetical protein
MKIVFRISENESAVIEAACPDFNLEYKLFKTSNVEPLTSNCGLGFEV